MRKRTFQWSIIIIICLGLISCRPDWRKSIPNSEIIYQLNEINKSPNYRIGFVDSNGENNQIIMPNQKFDKPVWAENGTFLYGLTAQFGIGVPTFGGYPAYWNVKNGKFRKCTHKLPFFIQIQGANNTNNPYEVIAGDFYEIYEIDLSKCTIERIIIDYSDQPGKYSIAGFSFSYDKQQLIYGLVLKQDAKNTYGLIRLDMNTGKEDNLGMGVHPTWSPDENKVAYLGLDGMYVLDLSDHNMTSKKILDHEFFDPGEKYIAWDQIPIPNWSPDGQWLIYHRCDKTGSCSWEESIIYKLNVSNGEEQAIIKGGQFPSWKP